MISELNRPLYNWLNQYFPHAHIILDPIPGDASFRRYFRLHVDNQTLIAVDAPPHTENNHAFIAIANAFAKLNLHVPSILQADLTHGFLLLTDLGDNVLFRVLTPENANSLYQSALIELDKIQRCDLTLPAFDAAFIHNELNLFHEWIVIKHLQLTLTPPTKKMLNNAFQFLVTAATKQPQCCVHRDYHSRNLMLLPHQKIGILDFQDAVMGPITYDAVSLLRDCYVDWPIEQVRGWLQFFHQEFVHHQVSSFEQFEYWFDLMGIQRHLKASFIFARKWHRDGSDAYLKDIPRAMCYILAASEKYAALKDFHQWMKYEVAPSFL